jgi:hypothetical protein
MISVFSSRPRPCEAEVMPSRPDMSSEPRPERPPSDLSSLDKKETHEIDPLKSGIRCSIRVVLALEETR